MSGHVTVVREDIISMRLGGPPEKTFRLYWRGDNFLFNHSGCFFTKQAIEQVIDAMEKLKVEYEIE